MLTTGEVIAMDRREILISIAGLAGTGACTARDSGSQSAGRPPLAIDAKGEGRWRIRSWEWSGGAWRPMIAHAVQGEAEIEISGRIEPANRAEVLARLTAQPSPLFENRV